MGQAHVGITRAGVVYELFFTKLPQQGFTACDVVELYLHRGAFEPALADEDQELDPDRWCSHSAWGQEAGANRQPLGLEPAPGVGASASARVGAHDRIRAGTAPSFTADGSSFRLYCSAGGLALESGPLLGPGLCSPARWNASVPGRSETYPT